MINDSICFLVGYALKNGLIEESDKVYSVNRLLEVLGVNDYKAPKEPKKLTLTEALDNLCDYAVSQGMIEDSVVYRDLFDTKIMGALTPRPSEVIAAFNKQYEVSPEMATDYFYKFSGDTNYIRRDRIARDVKWKTDTEYGPIDITINLSSPKKTQRR